MHMHELYTSFFYTWVSFEIRTKSKALSEIWDLWTVRENQTLIEEDMKGLKSLSLD